MDDEAIRGLLEATYRYANAAGLAEFGDDQRRAAEDEAVAHARKALEQLLTR